MTATDLQQLFTDQLHQSPPKTKEEAEIAAATAEILVNLAQADKTQEEILDGRRRTTRLQRWMQFAVGMVGLTGTIGGAFGTLYFMREFEEKRRALEQQERKVTADARENAEFKSNVASVEMKAEAAKIIFEANTLMNQVRGEKAEEEKRKSAQEIGQLQSRKEALAKQNADLESQNADLESQKKERETQIAARRKEWEELTTALEALPVAKKKELEKVVGPDSKLAVVANSSAGRTPVSGNSEAEITQLSKEVERLFSSSQADRGSAYQKFIKDPMRSNPALPFALVRIGTEKLNRYKTIVGGPDTSATKDEALLLRRGLENVVVSLRDISRKVTKEPTEARTEILAFVAALSGIGYGAEEESKTLKKWILP
jgi:DNA repair exonuclease SbcCD ATPase subunit